MKLFFTCLFCILCSVLAKNSVYKGASVYKITLSSKEQEKNIFDLQNGFIDFWRKPSFKPSGSGQVLVPKTHKQWFEGKLKELSIENKIQIQDVYQFLIDANENEPYNTGRNFDFEGYYRYSDILDYLYNIEANTNNVNIVEYGRTACSRPLIYVKVSSNFEIAKPVVIIEAGINPREWITISAAVNIVNKVMEDEQLLDNFDWIILPVVNPDGYEYTHTDERLWTKSLSTSSNLGSICPGVNINRNFDIDWQNWDSSSSPCSHLYAGAEPFSEIETTLIRELISNNNVQLYISLQNSGGFVSYPWHYEQAASGMFIQHYRIAASMIEALNINNTRYYLDSSAVAFGDRVSGTSTDYVFRNGVLYSFSLDILPDDFSGVIIDRNEILNIVNDVWSAVVAATRRFT